MFGIEEEHSASDYIGKIQYQLRLYDSMLQNYYGEKAKKEIYRRRKILKDSLESTNEQDEVFLK